MRAMFVGGSAAPRALIEAFERRYGLRIIHAWGMTEMAPLGTVGHLPRRARSTRPTRTKFQFRAKQGRPAPFVEIRARDEDGLVAVGRRDDGRARGARAVGRAAATTTAPTAPTASPTTAGSAPATSSTIDGDGTIQIRIGRRI